MMSYEKQCVRVVFVLLVAVLGLSNPSPAENTLVFAGLPDISPLSFEEDGVVKGFFSDVFRETASKIRSTPLCRMGLCDISCHSGKRRYIFLDRFPSIVIWVMQPVAATSSPRDERRSRAAYPYL